RSALRAHGLASLRARPSHRRGCRGGRWFRCRWFRSGSHPQTRHPRAGGAVSRVAPGARAKGPVVDADGHVIEPPDLWLRYMPARLRDRAPHTPDPKEPFMLVDGVELPPRRNYADRGHRVMVHDEERYREASATGFSPGSH